MSEITEISSVLDQGIQKLEERALEEHPNFREKTPEIKAVRIFMTLHDGKCDGVISRRLEMNYWDVNLNRSFVPVVSTLSMCVFGSVFYGTPMTTIFYATTMATLACGSFFFIARITQIAMESMFGEPNKYTHHQVKSAVHRAFKELDFDAVNPKHIRECSIEIQLSFPRARAYLFP